MPYLNILTYLGSSRIITTGNEGRKIISFVNPSSTKLAFNIER